MDHGRPLIFGEVLFDCFPDGREVPGGAPFNVAWNLQAFGQKPIFVSRVGEDEQGRLIREKMNTWGMNTTFLQSDPKWPTGRVEISLSGGEPKFAILPDQAYDYIAWKHELVGSQPPFLYHGSLALREDINRTTLAELKRNLSCPVFLDVNLRDPWWNKNSIHAMIKDATWLKLNGDECYTLFGKDKDLFSTCSSLLGEFNLEAVFLTLGSDGAAAFLPGTDPCSVKPAGSLEVTDTVGAGDAFSSVLLLGLTQKWQMQTILDRAQDFASAIVTQRGATLQDPSFYDNFKDKWM